MSRLAKNNTVVFASPPVYVRDVMSSLLDADSSRPGLLQISSSLYSYAHPRWLPYNYRSKKLEQIARNIRLKQIRKAMSSLGMKKPILYLWYPSFCKMIDEFDESLVVYHIYDEYASFIDQSKAETEHIIEQEEELLKRADIVFVTSEVICARKRPLNSNIYVVTNAVDYPLFASAQSESTRVPEDLLKIPGPVIGCVATQTPYMDLSLLRQIFTLRPYWSFVFIGIEPPDEHSAEKELLDLQSLPNVHFIGRRQISEIPGYLKGCDICVIPWILNDVTLSGSPLKLYEYLAAGKPIISKPLAYISHLDNVISFAGDVREWIAAIEDALARNTFEQIKERQAIALQNTWDQRAAFISGKLAEELARRR